MNNLADSDGPIIKSDTSPGRIAPISILDEDVLWHIFLLNVSIGDPLDGRVYSVDIIQDKMDRPLFTTFMSSQVCSKWRKIIVNSPSLWAQLIDLDGFALVDNFFKQEVMRRTGSSPLSIYGAIFAHKELERDFFISTLTENWPRIRSLKATIDRSKLIPASTWKVLSEPARSLQVLHLRSKDGITFPTVDSQGKDSNPLSGEAPFLRKLVLWRIDFNLGDCPGWTSNIRHLDVSYMTSMSISQWLYMLQQIPQLERLNLIKPFRSLSSDTTVTTLKLPSVNMPNLEAIFIIHRLVACAVFLDHIHPRAGCLLRLDTEEDLDYTLTPGNIMTVADLTKRVLSRYSASWFNSRCAESLFFSVTHQAFRISGRAYYIPNEEPTFLVQVNCQTLPDLPTILILLDAFSTSNHRSIKTLHLEVDIFPEQSLTVDVLRFLLTFPSVETLTFWKPQTMRNLMALIRKYQESSLFPVLSTIILDKRGRYDYELKHSLGLIQQDIFQFLTWRKENGRPVKTLDLTALKHEVQLAIFEGITDLKVLHLTEGGVQQEYICGR